MNVRRFTARSSRDALNLVKQAFGQEAVVLSTRPCAEGVEVLAMAPDGVPAYEGPLNRGGSSMHATAPYSPAPAAPSSASAMNTSTSSPSQDAERLAMSTLSFQDYVRERMLRRRRAELQGQPAPEAPAASLPRLPAPQAAADAEARRQASGQAAAAAVSATARFGASVRSLDEWGMPRQAAEAAAAPSASVSPSAPASGTLRAVVQDDIDDGFRPFTEPVAPPAAALPSSRQAPALSLAAAAPAAGIDSQAVVQELREMRGLIEQRFGALAYLEKLKREPRSAQLLQRLLEAGFSPVLARRLADALPADVEPLAWSTAVLERNLLTGERESPLEDTGGVFALIGPTGVGKTTSTAKLAAAFATRHGAANLGLITLDAYRVAAHEQLRAYGKILGVPVHTAHDRASLDDLLDLLSGKKMVLIDTAGMPPRDQRTAELLQMLSHRSVHRLLVLNATTQGESLDDVISAYGAQHCRGIVLSKIDETIKLAPALDAVIRHKLKVLAVANGQRVPEDWHRLSSATLVQRALREAHATSWKLRPEDVSLMLVDTRHREGGLG
ncbi:MAG: flagellar biosynthesis protein FlhF [Rubrivivax sp.]|jgi:flagellar biosynthesis protein FlhF